MTPAWCSSDGTGDLAGGRTRPERSSVGSTPGSLPLDGELASDGRELGFELEHPAYPGQGEPLRRHLGHALDPVDLRSGVAALATLRPGRLDDGFGVQPA